MGKLVNIGLGISASLRASPSSKAAKEPSAKLEVYCENCSTVPLDLQVIALHSSDASVASVSPAIFSPVLTVHLPRRPDKRTLFRVPPSTKQEPVGSWQPISRGPAELKVIVNAAPPDAASGGPTEDVEVT